MFSKDTIDGEPDTILVYNYASNRWTLIKATIKSTFAYVKDAITLDQLDSMYASLDDVPYTLDNPVFKGGSTRLGAITPDGRLAAFDGVNMEAVIETQPFRVGPETIVSKVRPVTDSKEARCAVRGGQTLNDLGEYGSYGSRQRDGSVSRRSFGLYQQVITKIPEGSDWSEMSQIELMINPRGVR